MHACTSIIFSLCGAYIQHFSDFPRVVLLMLHEAHNNQDKLTCQSTAHNSQDKLTRQSTGHNNRGAKRPMGVTHAGVPIRILCTVLGCPARWMTTSSDFVIMSCWGGSKWHTRSFSVLSASSSVCICMYIYVCIDYVLLRRKQMTYALVQCLECLFICIHA